MSAHELVVDVHHHYLPRPVFDRLAAQTTARRLVTPEMSLTLSPNLPDLEAHLQVMDEAGVDVALLTNAAASVLGHEVCSLINDGMARAAREHPRRLVGSIHLSVHEPEAAQRELARGIEELGLRAVALLATHRQVQLDDPLMDPLYERIAAAGLPIAIHPSSRPSGTDLVYALERSVGRPFETTQAIVRVLCGVLPRFPELRFIMPHLGGAVSALKGRIMAFFEPAGVEVPPGLRGALKTRAEQERLGLAEHFEALFRGLSFDSAGTGAWRPAFDAALNAMAPGQILFGSDYPLECKSAANMRESLAVLREAARSPEERAAMLGQNAAALLGLEGKESTEVS